nr:hypothetical protein [Tanacetum cinerariifolium]
MIEETHEEKTQINNGCNITFEDVERLRQILIPTIHTLLNLEPALQSYMPLSPFRDKESVARGKEHAIPLQDSVMQPLTPQTTHIIPPDDVAPATSPILDKHSNEFEEEFFVITRVVEIADGSHSKELEFEVSSTRCHVVNWFLCRRNHLGYAVKVVFTV